MKEAFDVCDVIGFIASLFFLFGGLILVTCDGKRR
jgi:hypothetical protein